MVRMDNARNAKMAKATRINRYKAALVKRNLIRRFGREQGEVRFWNSRWSQYLPDDMPALIRLSPEEEYAALLRGNPYVLAEAQRRLDLGWNFENSVRNALIAVQCDAQRVEDIYNEVGARIRRNDDAFENEVLWDMRDLDHAYHS